MSGVRARREALGVSRQALADYANVRLRAVVSLEERPAAEHAGPGHSPSEDLIIAALARLESNPRLLPSLQGDGPSHWVTVP